MRTYLKPANTRNLRENGQIILAHGEVTGHSHRIEIEPNSISVPDIDLYQYFEEPATQHTPARRVLLALAPCVLRHQEHDPIFLDPQNPQQARQGDVFLNPIGEGAWEVKRQQEYTPARILQVRD